MSETTSPAQANTLKVFSRNAFIGVGAVALALLAPEQEHDAHNNALPQTQTETVVDTPINIFEFEETVFRRHTVETQPIQTFSRIPATVSRTKKRTVPEADCWDGKLSDLGHTHAKSLGNIALACQLAEDESWYKENPKKEITCLVYLWDRESGWNPASHNKSSGAHGIAQALPGSKMNSVASNWRTSAATQITWGLGYIDDRYGSPCGALRSWDKKGWY
jgi:hypothetical protein